MAYAQIEFEIGRLMSNFTYNKPDLNDGKKLYAHLEELNQNINNLSMLFSKLYFGQN